MLLPYEVTKHKRPNAKTRLVIIATLIILGLALGYQTVTGLDKNVAPGPVHGSLPNGCTHTTNGLHCDLTDEATREKAKGVTWYEKREKIVKVSFYTSRTEETDDTPEISANGDNIWELYKKGDNSCASNSLKFGTLIYFVDLPTCTVRDRMNKRFDNTFRVDYYYGYDTKSAKQNGIQWKNISVFEKL